MYAQGRKNIQYRDGSCCREIGLYLGHQSSEHINAAGPLLVLQHLTLQPRRRVQSLMTLNNNMLQIFGQCLGGGVECIICSLALHSSSTRTVYTRQGTKSQPGIQFTSVLKFSQLLGQSRKNVCLSPEYKSPDLCCALSVEEETVAVA